MNAAEMQELDSRVGLDWDRKEMGRLKMKSGLRGREKWQCFLSNT